ncbi:MAG TPA: hypothetical protein VFU19_05175, partial [Iamia sp.]|nr:hypothetical protein [Iamia sp.]
AVYMYEGDAPLAERRAAALALDKDLLAELLGADELRDLLDADVLAEVEASLQHLDGTAPARDPDELHDLVRTLGPLTVDELAARTEPGEAGRATIEGWVDALVAERRAIRVGVAGEERVAAAEDAARLRDALGCAVPVGLPSAFTDPVDRPLLDLVARYARTHGPFLTREVAARYGVDEPRAAGALSELAADGRIVLGEFRPGGVEREWCDAEVLRRIRRRSLAALRREVEPVEADALARFLPAWQGVGLPRRGIDGLAEVLAVLQGAPIPASVLEADVLPARMDRYRPADLDALAASGDVVWVGAGAIGAGDGRVRLVFRDELGLLVPEPDPDARPEGAVHDVLRAHLAAAGASFWPQLQAAVAAAGLEGYDDRSLLVALWDLVWAGEVTNDTLAPLRAFVSSGTGKARKGASPRAGRPRPGRLTRQGPPAAAGRWSLVAPLRQPVPSPSEAALAKAQQLLERHGVLTREAALGEGVEGGFAGVYPVLRAMEDKGTVRRGYFVAGLGAAQFALPGAVDRLRAEREPATTRRRSRERVPEAQVDPPTPEGDLSGSGWDLDDDGLPAGWTAEPEPYAGGGWADDAPPPGFGDLSSTGDAYPAGDEPLDAPVAPVVLAATDPAQPYGAALPWPESAGRPARAAGAQVVLVDGRPLAYLERGGRTVSLFPGAAGRVATAGDDGAAPVDGQGPDDDTRWVDALVALVRSGRRRSVEITKVDGLPVRETDAAEHLTAAGFRDSYRGLVLRS